ncbi:MAG: glycosyltransferase [Chitinophagaceae bacterium]|nr:glycosyltransferase [Chitinophagaceae bacterium]
MLNIYAYTKAIVNFIKEKGLPKLAHVHVAFKAGILALWTKKRWKTPYIISEHSTIYLEESDNSLIDTSIFFRKTTSRVLKNASRLTVVSTYLGKAIQKHYPFVNYITIPNVVDTAIFACRKSHV